MDLNPQAENGHVDIANEIVEALCREQLSGYESRILWALFRKTYGWHKKEDRISLTQFQSLTGMPLPKISATLSRLVLRKMVRVTENGNGKIKSYGFQKVFSLWRGLPEKVLPKTGIPEKGITENGFQGLPKSASTKETITKEKTYATFVSGRIAKSFDIIYADYPRKERSKDAQRHYLASVKDHEDAAKIESALDNYLRQVKGKEKKHIMQGGTWFNNWRDYVMDDWQETAAELKKTWETEYANYQREKDGTGSDD